MLCAYLEALLWFLYQQFLAPLPTGEFPPVMVVLQEFSSTPVAGATNFPGNFLPFFAVGFNGWTGEGVGYFMEAGVDNVLLRDFG